MVSMNRIARTLAVCMALMLAACGGGGRPQFLRPMGQYHRDGERRLAAKSDGGGHRSAAQQFGEFDDQLASTRSRRTGTDTYGLR